jgi:hypothetical protein
VSYQNLLLCKVSDIGTDVAIVRGSNLERSGQEQGNPTFRKPRILPLKIQFDTWAHQHPWQPWHISHDGPTLAGWGLGCCLEVESSPALGASHLLSRTVTVLPSQ